MSAILGISANYHDAAAALVVDGQLVAAMQEERFSRVKNDASVPIAAARACLALAKLEAAALDEVVFYENPYRKLERVLLSSLRTFPRALRQFPRALASQLGGKLWVLDQLSSQLGVAREKVTHREHHASHAASAFFASPFERAAILTVDAVGEETSTALWLGEGNALTRKEHVAFPHSLGLLYSALTAYLGFEVNEGEYKVMGLAAFGKPRFRDEFARLISLRPDGFELNLEYFDAHTNTDVGFSSKLEALLGPRRAPGTPWLLDGNELDARCADIAATLQAVLEEALLALAARAKSVTGADALCLAGGVALNAVANARLFRDAGFSELFVQPAAGDAGGALGAALLAAAERGEPRTTFTHAAWGTPVSGALAAELGNALGLQVTRVSSPVEAASELLLRGEVLAWVQGRFEWGPRALGQRSLLALPTPLAVKERINRVIKRREPFRPFAPMVLESHAREFFGAFAPRLTPFMTTVADVNVAHVAKLEAVTHFDGTARLQTVRGDTLHGELLGSVGAQTGAPVLLNTSLNGQGEPIVATEADALAFLLAHPVDALLVDDALIRRR
ncbi:MAG: carbamoyl transferase [Archangium gephyra]|uniref:Carbamoyl transferase n=1 Tax=Archangium gephyra TaxID=48 RepID=A0A2W5U5A6_9BACT|nr:MAG: carbamoyl transferase [Archangium gephyra]